MRADVLPDDVLREGLLPDGDLPRDLLEDDRTAAVRREPAPLAVLPELP
ncbi:hypothetical protein GCM10009866_02440 [Cellulomonas aerilata]